MPDFPHVPLSDIATPSQVLGLTMLYTKGRYACPTHMENSPGGRQLPNRIVHPKPDAQGLPKMNQTSDPWSESQVRVFGKPVRIARDADPATIDDVLADAYAAVLAGKMPRALSKALINRLGRDSTKKYGSATAWRSYYSDVIRRAERERQESIPTS